MGQQCIVGRNRPVKGGDIDKRESPRLNRAVALLHLEAFAEREWRRWNRNLGWGWLPRLLVLLFSAVTVAGFLMLCLARKEPEPMDLFQVALFFAFAAHGWSVGGVVQVVAAEMEAGTLELLLLTRIRPRDLILGQLAFGLLGAVVTVIGLVPWLWVGWLNSGWSLPALGWVAGVWLAAGVAFNAVCLGMASFGRTLSAGGMASVGVGYLLLSTQWVVGAWVRGSTLASVKRMAWEALTFFGAVSVVGLGLAGWRLVRAVHASGRSRSSRVRAWMGAPRRPGETERRRLLEGNPIEWLASAGCPWWAWVAVAVGAGVPWWNGTMTGSEMFAAMSWVRGGVLVLLAFQAYGQLRYDLREGTWEALLRTPITVQGYVMGHVRAWWRQQAPLMAVVALVPAAVGIWEGRGDLPWSQVGILGITGVLLTAADALLASIWFLGAAVKFDGASFLFASVLSAGILTLMQLLHVAGGIGPIWPWVWAGLAAVIFWASRETVCREIMEQLDTAAGVERGRVPGWERE